MTFTETEVRTWIGRTVVDSTGTKIGKIDQVYLDDETNKPEWLAVKTGLFGGAASFVPLEGASDTGGDVQVGYTKDQVKDAPKIDEDLDLSPEEEETLYRHYGRSYGSGYEGTTTVDTAGTVGTGTVGTMGTGTVAGQGIDESRTVGRDTSGPVTDDAMTRSEEQLVVGTTRQEKGRVRLRKYVVTEEVHTTVPVSHEEIRIEREPITEANIGQAMDGPAISEEEHEVTLYEERPVVQKEVVAKERVRLDKEVVTEQVEVHDTVRKEQIEMPETITETETVTRNER